jgi:hypothetical protein
MITLRHALLPIVLAAACSSPSYEGSGFLEDDSKLAREEGGVWIYRLHRGQLADYDKLLLEPVEVLVHPASVGDDVSREELDLLAAKFLDELVRACEEHYPIVPEPGPGVLRLRVAITRVLPIPRLLSDPEWEARNLAAGRLGSASIEAEFRDSVSNELLGALAAKRSSRGYTGLIPGEISRFGKALGAFRTWAKRLRSELDEAHGS